MARPAKSLASHVRDGTFRARRHWPLLSDPPLRWPGFALLQARYQAATSDPQRRAIAVEFQQAVALVHEQAADDSIAAPAVNIDEELAQLGTPGSTKRLLGFFPHFLRHAKGSLRGEPFRLERWQTQFVREFFQRDRRGRRIYQRGLLGIPR